MSAKLRFPVRVVVNVYGCSPEPGTVAPRNERSTPYAVMGVFVAGVVNVRRTSSARVPESKLPTAAARLFGAIAVPGVPTAVTSAQRTYVVSPAVPPELCAVVQPMDRPLESSTGALDVR